MNWLTDALRRIGLFGYREEILSAENEDALVDHRKVLNELTAATVVRREITSQLRVALEEAKMQSVSLAGFEQNTLPPFIPLPLDHQGD